MVYEKLVTAIRIVFGVQMTLSGLNWWVKLTLYPSMSDFAAQAPPDNILGALVATGFMFDIVKATELLGGIALLANRFVPLALVAMLPVAVPVFLTDVFINTRLRGTVMGTSAMVQQAFLMFAYLGSYRTLLVAKAEPDPL